MLRPHFLLSLLIVFPLFAAELVEVPCAEFKLLTGQDLCDMRSTLKWEKSAYEAQKRKHAWKKCRDAVWSKYSEYSVRRTSGGTWHQDSKPDDVAEKDWISCHPVRLTSGYESHACWDELVACNERHAAKPKKKDPKPKEQIKLF